MTGPVKKTEREEGFLHLNETPEEIAFELRAQEGAVWTGGRLVIGIWIFAFASLAFAYFYLRSANNQDLWRPGGITAPTAAGAAIFAVSVACALLCVFARPWIGRWPAGRRSSAVSWSSHFRSGN